MWASSLCLMRWSLALKHKKATFANPITWVHYLSLFNYIIPGLISSSLTLCILEFSSADTGGWYPTSLVGSLYLNFSYVGVVVGCGLLGLLLQENTTSMALMRSNLSIAYYAMLVTFTYDILRVGEI